MTNIFKQRLSLLNSIDEIVQAMENGSEPAAQNYLDIKDALLALGLPKSNKLITLAQALTQSNSPENIAEFCKRFNRFYDSQIAAANSSLTVSESYTSNRLGCDREFNTYVKFIKAREINELIEYVFGNLKKLKDGDALLYERLTVHYRGWYFEGDQLNGFEGENNSLITHRMTVLKENIDKICELYNMLADNLSRITLNALIHNWLTFSPAKMFQCANYLREAVDINLFSIYADEVFVDCGSYIGDTVLEYCENANTNYKRIYTYDISQSTVDKMKENLKDLSNIVYNVKGVGEFADTLELSGVATPFEGNKLVTSSQSNTHIKVPVVKLDDDITEEISFLKIDVEGLDKEAIRGAREQIQRNHPKLAIDAYHKLVDFFEIPLLIRDFDNSYNIYLRIANKVDNPLFFPRPSVYAL